MRLDAIETIRSQYYSALEMLAKRMLGEPYNFHRIQGQIKPGILPHPGFQWNDIIEECILQFDRNGSYSCATIAANLKIGFDIPDEDKERYTPQFLTNYMINQLYGYSLEFSETDLPTAYAYFLDAYGRYVETQIASSVGNWLLDGYSALETVSMADKMRREKSIAASVKGSDGRQEFEAELFASMEGKIFDHPIKPFLRSMREKTYFYEPEDYIVVAMLTGAGKSYYALNQMYYSASQGHPCLYVNLENSPKSVQKRLWQMHIGEGFKRDFSYLTMQEMKQYKEAWEHVKELPIRSVNPGRNLENVVSVIREERYERGIGLAAIDYAQLMKVRGHKGGRNYELAEISATLRALNLELKIPIMIMAQVLKDVWNQPGHRASMYHVKDCSEFAFDATVVELPYRPEYVKIENDPDGNPYPKGYADIHRAKGRDTGTGVYVCQFDWIRGFHDLPVVDEFERYNPMAGITRPAFDDQDIPF